MKFAIILLLLCSQAFSQDTKSILSESAPEDKPVRTSGDAQRAKLEEAIRPYIEKALQTYPQAKDRYLAGLEDGESFFVTTRIKDPDGTYEQIFLYVEHIANEQITGQIFSQLRLVKSFTYRQRITIKESDIVDWLITKPDGSEEGNYVGKFLDNYKP